MKHRSKFVAAAFATAVMTCLAPVQALADDLIGVNAKVVFIEATYIPDSITIMIDQPLGACPANTLIRYFAQGVDAPSKAANIAAVFSLLITAKTANQTVTLSGYTSNCAAVRFVSLP